MVTYIYKHSTVLARVYLRRKNKRRAKAFKSARVLTHRDFSCASVVLGLLLPLVLPLILASALAGAAALFKQYSALFACNYQAGDLTLATLHLYNVTHRCFVRYASSDSVHSYHSAPSVPRLSSVAASNVACLCEDTRTNISKKHRNK